MAWAPMAGCSGGDNNEDGLVMSLLVLSGGGFCCWEDDGDEEGAKSTSGPIFTTPLNPLTVVLLTVEATSLLEWWAEPSVLPACGGVEGGDAWDTLAGNFQLFD